MKHRKCLGIFLLPFAVSITYCQVFKTLDVEFIRKVQQNNSTEIVKGHIYFDSNKSTIITEEPINQWMILENNILLIYYPVDRKAIKIKSRNPILMPFSQLYYGLSSENFELTKLGYTISKNERHDDTLSIHWKPPKDLEKNVGEYIVAMKGKKIISTEVKNPDKKTIALTLYDNHIRYNNQFFPLKIESHYFLDNTVTTEIIELENPDFDKPLPQNILNFKLPVNLDVKEIEW